MRGTDFRACEESRYVVSGFLLSPKVSARLAEARFAREGGSRTMMVRT
jgi:hypothetical protein